MIEQKGHVLTATGSALYSTAQAKFGTTSLLINGTGGNNVRITPVPAAPGAGKFQIDAWVYVPSTTTGTSRINNDSSNSKKMTIEIRPGREISFVAADAGFGALTGGTASADAWTLITIIRGTGGGIGIYKDGVQQVFRGSDGYNLTTLGTNWFIGESSGPIHVGEYRYARDNTINPFVVGTFTLPTEPFPDF